MKDCIRKLDLAGFAIIVVAMVRYSVTSVWTPYLKAALILGAILMAVGLVSKRDQIRQNLTRRSARYGANSLTSVVLLIGVLGLVNYIGVQNDQRVDMTTTKIYSLAEQSVSVADQVEQDVLIRAFFSGGDDTATRRLLDLYTHRSSRITYEFIDPDERPQLAEQFDVTVYGVFNNPLTGQGFNYGTVVFETEGFEERIEQQSEPLREEDVTNALMKLIKGEQKTIYFIEGHGEKLIAQTEQIGMDVARNALERENYVVETLNLVRVDAVPENASVLIWPGPQTEPFPEEMDMVDEYLNGGGSVFVMVDPPPAVSLDGLLDRWSVSAGDDFVVDASGVGRLLGAGPEIPLVSQYGTHVITNGFNVMTFFPLARSLATAETPAPGLSVTALLTTGNSSWGESDLDSTEASYDPATDLSGPVDIGLVITKDLGTESTPRLLVVGDSDFASNGFFGLQGNGNLFLNAVNWLAEDESFISIRPKAPEDRPFSLTQAQGRITYYVSLVLMPLSILVIGISVWIQRRKQ